MNESSNISKNLNANLEWVLACHSLFRSVPPAALEVEDLQKITIVRRMKIGLTTAGTATMKLTQLVSYPISTLLLWIFHPVMSLLNIHS